MPKKEIDFKLELNSGKYTFIYYKDGSSEALRHGEAWRDTTGDNLIHALAYALNESIVLMARTKEVLRSTSGRLDGIGESLVDQVKMAQVRAGEDAVCAHLESMDLARKIVGKG